ncbi:MAG: ABC transporter ATP-binding protein [Fusobacteriaceae bacterium]
MKNIIEFKNFTFKYGNLSKPTLKNINLTIKRGEKVLIAGSSGSGKSTLGYCLNGLIPFSKKGIVEGELKIDGILTKNSSVFELSKKVGTILQDQDCQFVGLSVGEDVAFIDENHNVSPEEMFYKVERALLTVDMLEEIKKTPQELSGGQKQRVSLAGIFNSDAPILLLDEPLANLDPASGAKTVKLINEIHNHSGATIVVIEHRIEEILEGNFDRVIVMQKGEIVADGTPDEILRDGTLLKYGLREPLYIDALKYAGIDLKNIEVYPIQKSLTDDTKKRVMEWCKSSKTENNLESEKILEVENISFSYDGIKNNLDGVNLTLHRGEIVAILGNNGAGKSTLSKVITGIERNKFGKIEFLGREISGDSIKKRSEMIGYVMQNPNHMLTQESVLDEVELGIRLRKIENSRELAEKTLKICGLNHLKNWPVTALSYGQKKRVTIAAILALNPQVIILDEPTAGQDHAHYLEFMNFVKTLSEKGMGIILITHDMHLSLEYAHKAIVLSKGKILMEDRPSAVFSNREVMKKANLRETSLLKLAELTGIDGERMAETFIKYEEEKRCQDQECCI